MKKITIFAVMALAGMLSPFQSNAQGLGDLLRKGKAAVEKGAKTVDKILGNDQKTTTAESAESAKGSGMLTGSGITVFNPISSYIEVEPIGLYGISTSETRGDVYLVMKVTNKEPKQTALFGSSIQNQKMIAADDNGQVYNIDASGAMRYDTPQDMTVKVVMREPQMMFTNLKKDITVMPMVKIGVSLDAYHQGNLTFKNVPIYWDEEP